jgi:hypothetical protein
MMKNRINYFLLVAVIVLSGLYLYSFKAKDNGNTPRKYIVIHANGQKSELNDGTKSEMISTKDGFQSLIIKFNELESQGYELIQADGASFIFRSK